MRITEAKARENREKIVAVAAELFRRRGFDGIGVGDLMKAAGFTHGGFYNHFGSKDALSAEALDQAFRAMDAERARAPSLEVLLKAYLSDAARRAPERSCPAAALAGDVARQPQEVKQVFAEGLERILASLGEHLEDEPDRRAAAIDLFARMAGAMMLARATPAESGLGEEILGVVLRSCLEEIGADQTSQAIT